MIESPLKLKDLYIGKSDGKHELDVVSEDDFESGFFLPENVDKDEILSGHRFLVIGHRGTGKTTLLRWLGIQSDRQQTIPFFLLFKSQISEETKQKYSITAGIKEISLGPKGYSILQDFKDVWRIVLLARACEEIVRLKECVADIGPANEILKLLGYDNTDNNVFGYLPDLLKSLKIKATDPGTGVEYEAGMFPTKETKEYSPQDLSRMVRKIFGQIQFRSKMLLLIDEIEVFFKTDEQYNRDLAMVILSRFLSSDGRRLFPSNPS